MHTKQPNIFSSVHEMHLPKASPLWVLAIDGRARLASTGHSPLTLATRAGSAAYTGREIQPHKFGHPRERIRASVKKPCART